MLVILVNGSRHGKRARRKPRHDWIIHRMPLMRRVPERLVFIEKTQ
jgi:hypothetical protein